MATPQQAEEYRANQARIAELVARDVHAFFVANDPTDPSFPGLLREFVRSVVESYGPLAATIAADYYDMLRDAAGVPGTYLAEPGEYLQTWDLLALQEVADWALEAPSPTEMQGRLARRLAKHVQQWGRDTLTDNAKNDPAKVRFARVPEGKTCAFCLMLASRGAVYRTAHDAGELNEFHDSCDCQIVPVFPGEKLPYDAAGLSKLYNQAREAAGSGEPSAILAELRKIAPVTDAVKWAPEARAIADAAKKAERRIARDVRAAVTASGGRLERQDTQLKTLDSLLDKMRRVEKQGRNPTEVEDALRFTAVLDSSTYWADVEATLQNLRVQGFEVVSAPGGWRRRGYRGVNVVLRNSSGQKFELQLHTAESLEAAEQTHKLYELERSPNTGSSERKRLQRRQREIFDAVPWPPDVPEI